MDPRLLALLLSGLAMVAGCHGAPGPNPCPAPAGFDLRAHVGGHNLILEWPSVAGVQQVKVQWDDPTAPRRFTARVDAAAGRYVLMRLQPRSGYTLSVTNICGQGVESPTQALAPITTEGSPVQSTQVTVPWQGPDDNMAVLYNCFGEIERVPVSYAAAMTRKGEVLWAWGPSTGQRIPDVNWSPERGTLLVNVFGFFTELDLAGDTVYVDRTQIVHHGVIYVPSLAAFVLNYYRTLPGYELYSPRLSEGIRLTTPDGAQLWDWHLDEHVDASDYNPEDIKEKTLELGYDWTHANDINFIPQRQQFVLVARNLDRIFFINYPSGEVAGTLGSRSKLCDGIWSHPHELEFLEIDPKVLRGRFMIFDNGNFRNPQYSRALEVEFDEEADLCRVIWEYREVPDFYDEGLGAAYRLESGNTLITDGLGAGQLGGRVIEVERTRRKAWEVKLPGCFIYQAKPVPRSFFERGQVTVEPTASCAGGACL